MSVTPLLELSGVSKTYRSKWPKTGSLLAVDNISLSLNEGEVFGFVGPNGAGKSTVIKILTGGISRFDGSATLNGIAVSNPASRKGLGYVPENPYLSDYLSPVEILEMGIRLHGVRIDSLSRHVLGWIERFGLGAVANKQIRGFSKGMTQRVALAHAMAIMPRTLILDEPLSGLDPIGRREVVEILVDYKRNGGAIFFTSHVLHDVERLADRFGLIHQGKLRTVQTPGELVGTSQVFSVRSSGAMPVEGLTADTGGRWFTEVNSDALWPTLEKLKAAGHSIIEVRPALSLETAFMRLVGE